MPSRPQQGRGPALPRLDDTHPALGPDPDRALLNQSLRASGLNLVIAAIVYWNTVCMERTVQHLRSTGIPAPDPLLTNVAPLGWEHISLTGDYLWEQAAETPLDSWTTSSPPSADHVRASSGERCSGGKTLRYPHRSPSAGRSRPPGAGGCQAPDAGGRAMIDETMPGAGEGAPAAGAATGLTDLQRAEIRRPGQRADELVEASLSANTRKAYASGRQQ
ncbi:MAG: Tn3 family transposase [Inquilinus sp.]|uniref:Tn3 family transposase n=1 Tax=Inquilinus sp. TaxID=1932117 RepID=UPI003F3F3605